MKLTIELFKKGILTATKKAKSMEKINHNLSINEKLEPYSFLYDFLIDVTLKREIIKAYIIICASKAYI